ncbi:MAG: hypothetical protein H0U75_01215 [Legionella sp.]|nr:hypothetical protein [Legionella sp.]
MRQQSNFFNTISAEGQQLISFDNTAHQQRERVLDIFQLNAHRSMTTREAHLIYISKYDGFRSDSMPTPHDSIKRAITNLTTAFELTKNSKEEMVSGLYGKPVFTWRIKS